MARKNAAFEAWSAYGGHALASAENDLYPPVEYADFRTRALARIRAASQSRQSR
ncbi:MAG: hypothetical protein R3C60_11225 [Parvularculaceae bacterium]